MNISLIVTITISPSVDNVLSQMEVEYNTTKSRLIREIAGLFLRKIGYDDPEDMAIRSPSNNLVISSDEFNRALVFRVNRELAGVSFLSENSLLMYVLSNDEANEVEEALASADKCDLSWVKFNFTESYPAKRDARTYG